VLFNSIADLTEQLYEVSIQL